MRIAIYGRVVEEDKATYVRHLFEELEKREINVIVYEEFMDEIRAVADINGNVSAFVKHEELKTADYLLSLGGDGTLLDTVKLVRDAHVPVVGINLGTLGFLSSVGKDEISTMLDALHNKTYVVDKRNLLHLDANKPLFDGRNFALNEFTIHRKDTSSMIVIHAFLNGEFLSTYWADGIIVATPTGSTGYSLSCGGPVVHPSANNLIVTPVAPHNLNIRPLVIPDDSVLSFEVEGRADNFLATLDSQFETIDDSFQLAVRKEDFTLNLIRLHERNFLTTLRTKLFWGIDKRN